MNVSRTNRRRKGWVSKHPLSLVGSLVIAIGFVALFMPDVIRLLLPEAVVSTLSSYAMAIIGAGIACDIGAIVMNVRQAEKTDKSTLSDSMSEAPTMKPGKHGLTEEDIAWIPLKGGGANFKTHKLLEVNGRRLEIVATLQMKLFCWLFIIMGGGIGGFIAYSAWQDGEGEVVWVPLIVGLVFVLAGSTLLYFTNKAKVFDLALRWYWRGDKHITDSRQLALQKDAVKLDDIEALQLLSERCTSSGNGARSSYYSYELNLILDTGKRVNVMDHGSASAIAEDSETIARLLNVPVWNRM